MLLSKFPPLVIIVVLKMSFTIGLIVIMIKILITIQETCAILPGSKKTWSTEHENHTTIYAKYQYK